MLGARVVHGGLPTASLGLQHSSKRNGDDVHVDANVDADEDADVDAYVGADENAGVDVGCGMWVSKDEVHNALFSPEGVGRHRVGAGRGRHAVVSKYIGADGASQPVSVIVIGVTC